MTTVTVFLKNQKGEVLETIGMPVIPREGEKVSFYIGSDLACGYVHSVAYLVGSNFALSSVDVILTNITNYG